MKKLNLLVVIIYTSLLISQEKAISMQRIESLSWAEPYPVGQIVRINTNGDILAIDPSFRTVYDLKNGSTVWNSNLNTTSDVTDIYYSPSGTRAFVGTESTGLYYCPNTSSYTWTQILVETKVFSIATSSTGRIFAGTTDGLYRSGNDGVSWSISYNYPLKMAISTADEIYIEEYNKGLCRSADGGDTWEEINYNIPKETEITDLQVGVNGDVFISVRDTGIYRLSGTTWIEEGFQYINVNSFHAAADGYLYCSRTDQIFKKMYSPTPGGWTLSKDPEGRITSFSSNTSKVIAGHTDVMQIFKTTDSGVSWSVIGTPVYPTIYSLLNVGSYVYAGTASGLYVSADNGATWTEKLPDYIINTLELGPSNSILAGSSGGFYKSDDSGSTWYLIDSCPVPSPQKILFTQNIYFVGGYRALYRTATFATWYGGAPSSFTEPYDMVRTSGGRHYVSDPTAGIFYTDDLSTWAYTGYDNSYCIEIESDGDIYAGSSNAGAGGGPRLKVLRAGQTEWTDAFVPLYDIADIFTAGSTVLASCSGRIYYSLFSGSSWSSITLGLPADIVPESLSMDDSSYIYAGLGSAKGLYKSTTALSVK